MRGRHVDDAKIILGSKIPNHLQFAHLQQFKKDLKIRIGNFRTGDVYKITHLHQRGYMYQRANMKQCKYGHSQLLVDTGAVHLPPMIYLTLFGGRRQLVKQV
jgi:hypothetical protein